ncbi:hypothetical protein K443DRAFT_13009 [Laccaria amethystina LaAM-08-1]|uniref:Uncharacterized protein n=1 Tax=Laccaria amethystina LaAM-08-1 TaxID=1095629 RepID=A0A0C9XAD7_9AGAR|nr:hypothetical protein K443DRAFT_15083 [Laccaria amethystina LaAM-08-1]KIJ93242.1 hypothetical protein K443DRAFT_13009 [Laccaria amethystina LaAM-08-1]
MPHSSPAASFHPEASEFSDPRLFSRSPNDHLRSASDEACWRIRADLASECDDRWGGTWRIQDARPPGKGNDGATENWNPSHFEAATNAHLSETKWSSSFSVRGNSLGTFAQTLQVGMTTSGEGREPRVTGGWGERFWTEDV